MGIVIAYSWNRFRSDLTFPLWDCLFLGVRVDLPWRRVAKLLNVASLFELVEEM